jgi:hypothetical protein
MNKKLNENKNIQIKNLNKKLPESILNDINNSKNWKLKTIAYFSNLNEDNLLARWSLSLQDNLIDKE